MDEDTLEEATDRWVAADLIDAETAMAIRSFEADRTDSGWNRRQLVWLLAAMGAVLVGAGIVVFLATRWPDLPTLVRTSVLLAVPPVAAIAGIGARRRGLPLVGHACWLLAVLLVGPSIFGLAELHAPTLAWEWRLLAWGTIALPLGHTFPSSLGVMVGLVTLLGGAGLATGSQESWFVVGFLGGVVATARIPAAIRDPPRAQVYGVVGAATGLLLFLLVSAEEGEFGRLMLTWDGLLLATSMLAGVTVIGLLLATRIGPVPPAEASLAIAPMVATVVVAALVTVGGDLHWLSAHLLIQAAFLAYVLAIAVVGVWAASRWLINLATVGFLLLVLLNLTLLAGELTGAVALVAAGVVLLLAAIVLERGRRAFLGRLDQG